jgi:hypothetical protein
MSGNETIKLVEIAGRNVIFELAIAQPTHGRKPCKYFVGLKDMSIRGIRGHRVQL